MKADKLIFWDIDGTLLSCGSDGTKALNRTFLELYGIENAFSRATVGSAMDFAIVHGIMDAFELEKTEFPRIKERYEWILSQILDDNLQKRELPGVRKILTALEETSEVVNALLTSNFQSGAEIKLRSVGLDGFFALGGFGDEPGEKWDAAERGIELAQERYDTVFSRDRIYLIGDGIYDILTAKKLGIHYIAVGTGWVSGEEIRKHEPEHYFDDLSKTDLILKILLNSKDWKL